MLPQFRIALAVPVCAKKRFEKAEPLRRNVSRCPESLQHVACRNYCSAQFGNSVNAAAGV
jgi:hypothetical protein